MNLTLVRFKRQLHELQKARGSIITAIVNQVNMRKTLIVKTFQMLK